jgi:hypothetical protein
MNYGMINLRLIQTSGCAQAGSSASITCVTEPGEGMAKAVGMTTVRLR